MINLLVAVYKNINANVNSLTASFCLAVDGGG